MTAEGSPTEAVEQNLAKWRERLLDFSKRNPLLAFRPTKSGTLSIIAPGVARLIDVLVAQEKTLTFYPPQSEAADLVGETLADSPIAAPAGAAANKWSGGEESQTDDTGESAGWPASAPAQPLRPNEIRAGGDPKKQTAILYRMRLRARAAIEELGSNTLFLAVGFLEWSEPGAHGDVLRSPLALVPVSLGRAPSLDRFELSLLREEEIVLNPTLVEKMRRDFAIELPSLDTKDEFDAGSLFAAVRAAVARQPGWRVVEEVSLGLFSFLKLTMYNDLLEHGVAMAEHPIVRTLAGDASRLPPPPPDAPAEGQLDAQLPPNQTFHFLDADSSQLHAITLAARGANLIIQGPPGTGKSQTIANLIAEALAKQKKVLFVSEKLAALQVVYRRLAERGLDQLCLEVHSHQANKRAVLDQLGRSLDAVDPGPPDGTKLLGLASLGRARDSLNAYVDALHQTGNPLCDSVFSVQALMAQYAAAPTLIFRMRDVDRITPEDRDHHLDLIGRLGAVGHVLLDQEHHPWRGILAAEASLELRAELRTRFERTQRSLEQGRTFGERFAAQWGLSTPLSLARLRWLDDVLGLLASNPAPPAAWFTSSSLAPYLESARAHADQAMEYHRRRALVLARYDEGVLALPVADLAAALGAGAEDAVRPFGPAAEASREAASAAREPVSRTLDQARAAVEGLLAEAQALATALGLPPLATIEDVRFLITVAELTLRDPRPAPRWLERTAVIGACALAEAAREQAALQASEEAALFAQYDARLLDIAPELAERYKTRYGFFRSIRPSYWRDRKALRALHNGGAAPKPSEAMEALERALRLRGAREWLTIHEPELLATFGHHPAYVGAETGWDTLVAASTDTREVLDAFGASGLPTALRDLLIRGGAALAPLRIPAQRLRQHLAALEEALATLAGVVDLSLVAAAGDTLEATRAGFARWHDQLQRFWSAEEAIRNHRRIDQLRSIADLSADLAEIAALNDLATAIAAESQALQQQFGSLFTGLETDWQHVLEALEWTQHVKERFAPDGPPGAFVARIASAATPNADEHAQFTAALDEDDEGLAYVRTRFEEEAFRPGGVAPEQASLVDLEAWLRVRVDRLGDLEEWLDYLAARRALVEAGLEGLLSDLDHDRIAPEHWRDAFLKRFYGLWLDEQHRQLPALRQFRGAHQRRLIEEFRNLDVASLALAPRRVLHAVLEQRPPINVAGAGPSEPAILVHELQKRKRHKSIRRLFREIPHLLTTLKPCLLMSPLSVSQYLDPASVHFDLVIFDEASQVLPEDALGAIFRGSQLVVAGDSQQMPPTQFFQKGFDEAEDESEDDEGVFESILDLCAAKGFPRADLRWHYRSRDERLIAFSNRHFYDGRLVTFPSPFQAGAERGIAFVHVPDGVYDRGGSRTNRIEARHVADLVIAHAERQTGRSLGVVAFSMQQMLAILTELEARRRAQPDLEDFFREDGPEPFFVKNLETVQGDERDVTFFSVGYGKDIAGNMSASFGPLNRSGGERRLNVAITRAREHVKFVSSILPGAIDLSSTKSEGVKLLRQYMEYAIQGPVALAAGPAVSVGGSESPFEDSVVMALRQRGLRLEQQIGCAGFRIDMAVAHRDHPGRYVLGIECDGATYHSSKTARDRDRLRQQVLEGLGWRIHRIWSTDWIKDPEREIQAVLQAVEQAYDAADTASLTSPSSSASAAPIDNGAAEVGGSAKLDAPTPQPAPHLRRIVRRAADRVRPYRMAPLEAQRSQDALYDGVAAQRMIAGLVERCVNIEGPVHQSRVTEYVAHSYGYARVRERAEEQIKRGVAAAVRARKVAWRGEFLWPIDMRADDVPVRGPDSDGKPRTIEVIAPEEVAQAVLLVLEENFSLPEEALVVQTARLLGYERTGALIAERVRQAVEEMAQRGTIVSSGGMLRGARAGEREHAAGE